tara:strand:- start:451 stop:759 length:309 start_codon:yes stop_codon:yes gene_type:complete
MNGKHKTLSFSKLKEINDNSIKAKLNRTIDKKSLERLKNKEFPIGDKMVKLRDTTFLVTFAMIHNDKEMRCQIRYAANEQPFTLDMDMADYDKLDTTIIHNA